jgi:hypothetical protein
VTVKARATLADGLRIPTVGAHSFDVCKNLLDEVISGSGKLDQAIRKTKFWFSYVLLCQVYYKEIYDHERRHTTTGKRTTSGGDRLAAASSRSSRVVLQEVETARFIAGHLQSMGVEFRQVLRETVLRP